MDIESWSKKRKIEKCLLKAIVQMKIKMIEDKEEQQVDFSVNKVGVVNLNKDIRMNIKTGRTPNSRT